MKKIVLIIVALLGITSLYAQVVNDPNAEVREAKNFHAISVSSSFDVYLTQGNDEAVAVSAADANFRKQIKVEVKDGVLSIGLEKGNWKWGRGNKKLKAYISFKQLDKLTASGACDVFIQGTLKADDLRIDCSGASDMKGKLSVKKLKVDLSGASDMIVTGTVDQLIVDASGASDFKGLDLSTDFCTATASGASDIRVTVNKELSANASGASDVKYKGQGVIRDIRSTGASSVSKI